MNYTFAAFVPNPANASNILAGTNPAYDSTDFLAAFPQFGNDVAASGQIDYYIGLATAMLQQARWGDLWEYAVGLCVAHFLTLALQVQSGTATPNASAVVAAAQNKGTVASKSVGDVSVSYQFTALDNYKDWGGFLLTAYGTQLATLGELAGMGGMYIW